MVIFVIKNIRKSKNISLYKLSKLTGITRSYLRDLENNKKKQSYPKNTNSNCQCLRCKNKRFILWTYRDRFLKRAII